ncbi:11539_t:CDS:2 [Funneliformis caledonium]|uniref:11539_t:CDS:1 n=1 Tax=Funneliformis caledonium TaxID=1117310 RepID=A0A9N9FCY3_9GLOM|nr:11539_t:CDS:2 [Funneliformis caledonium]
MLSESQFDILDSLDLYSNDNEKPFGRCPGCKKTCYALAWCDTCDRKALVDKFENKDILLLIQESQRWATDYYNYLEFIPYNHFKDIKYIGEGGFEAIPKATWLDGSRIANGFGEISKATWNDGVRIIKKVNGTWKKTRSEPCAIVLKEIKESGNIDQDYIDEVIFNIYPILNNCRYYGITQNPITKNFSLIMDYPHFGSCSNCNKEFHAPDWCNTCDRKALIDKFDMWSSGNENIDLLIQNNDIWYKTRSKPYVVSLKEIKESENIDQDYINKVLSFICNLKAEFDFYSSNRKDRLKWQKKLQYLYFICNGIRGIHQLNYVHGDIHCGNILLKYTSDICITDLGLSRPANSKEASQNKSSDDPPAGNIPYLAPELLKKYPKSKASDIYAIGILMTEFASHDRAFENYNSTDLKIDIYRGERPKFPPETPNCYVELMKECLDDDPNKRPTAEKLVKSISGWLKSDWKSKSNLFNIADKQWNRNVSKG